MLPAAKQVGDVVLIVGTDGKGFTIISKVIAGPVQKPLFTVTVIVAICCVVTFAAVNVGIVPVPLAPILPIEVLLQAQLIVAPVGLLTKLIAGIIPFTQTGKLLT